MDRHRYRESIGAVAAVRSNLSSGFNALLDGVDFIGDHSSIFLGLNHVEKTQDNRKYCDTSHVIYRHFENSEPRSRKKTTIVLCEDDSEWWYKRLVILHEIGHAIHERVDFITGLTPLDSYAERNTHETFATAFQSFCTTGIHKTMQYYHDSDHLFDSDRQGYEMLTDISIGGDGMLCQ